MLPRSTCWCIWWDIHKIVVSHFLKMAPLQIGRDGWIIELMEATSRRRCLFLSLKGFQQQCQGSLVQMLEASVGEEEASALISFIWELYRFAAHKSSTNNGLKMTTDYLWCLIDLPHNLKMLPSPFAPWMSSPNFLEFLSRICLHIIHGLIQQRQLIIYM